MRKLREFFLFFLFAIMFYFVVSSLNDWINPDGVEINLDEIRLEREVVLTDIDTLRGETPDVFIFTSIKSDQSYKIYLGTIDTGLYHYLEKGDVLLKKANDNICLILRGEKTKKFSYMRIPYRSRLNKNFPIEWRCKWLESSEWDSLSSYKKKILKICEDNIQ